MTEFSKRVSTSMVLISILALLFLYGSNTSLVVTIYLIKNEDIKIIFYI